MQSTIIIDHQDIVFDLSSPITIIAHFDACQSVATQDIVGPSIVEGGSIYQYTFPSEFTNTSEWSVSGGEILFTSSFENTIGIQWNFGSGEGQIVLSQYNFEGALECLFVNIQINEADIKYNCIDQDCVAAQGGQYASLGDCLMFCDGSNNTGLLDDIVLQEQVIVFPNPAIDYLNVIITSEMLVGMHLFDISGKKVYSCSDCAGMHDNHYKEIDVSSLGSGVYVLVAETAESQILEKITIQ